MKLHAVLCATYAGLPAGSDVKLLDPVRDTEDWTVATASGQVLAVPREKLRTKNYAEAAMRLECERAFVLLQLQDTTRPHSEIAMAAACSYELNRLLAALPAAVNADLCAIED